MLLNNILSNRKLKFWISYKRKGSELKQPLLFLRKDAYNFFPVNTEYVINVGGLNVEGNMIL